MPVPNTNLDKSPYRGRGETTPSLARSLRSLALPLLTNLGCTTVTGIAKMHKGAMPPPPPIDRRTKEERKGKVKCFPETNSLGKEWKRTRVGNWSMPLHKLPLIMVSNVQENAVFRHKYSKISLPWEGGHPHSPPPPPPSLAPLARAWSLRSLAYYRSLRLNPGYATG